MCLLCGGISSSFSFQTSKQHKSGQALVNRAIHHGDVLSSLHAQLAWLADSMEKLTTTITQRQENVWGRHLKSSCQLAWIAVS